MSGRIDASNGNSVFERAQDDQRGLRGGTPVEAGSTEREPGEAYAIYRSRDILGVLPESMEAVISYGAKWIGVDEELVLKVSEGFERRLWKWWGRVRRQEGIEARRMVEFEMS